MSTPREPSLSPEELARIDAEYGNAQGGPVILLAIMFCAGLLGAVKAVLYLVEHLNITITMQ